MYEAQYAITHEAAGQRYAPFLSTVSQVRCRLMGGTGSRCGSFAHSMLAHRRPRARTLR